MNTDDRFCAKCDDVLERMMKKLDDISNGLSETRRYNRDTTLIMIILWGLGLPVVFFGSVLYAATRPLGIGGF